MTTKTVNEIWNELADNPEPAQGLLLRRCPISVVPDIFVAVSRPENHRCLAISISPTSEIDVSEFSDFRDMVVEVSYRGPNKGQQFVLFKLVNNELDEIFAVLCDDLISAISRISDEAVLIKQLLSRLASWKTLFDKAKSEGLSPESQRGLFGELSFLRHGLDAGCDPLAILDAWVGPSGNIRDYQWGDFAVEVKTTHGNNHQRIQISNERQLDRTNLTRLFLYHLSLEALQNTSETLNQIVDNLLSRLTGGDSSRFRGRLFEYGYFDRHRENYDSIGYRIRDAKYFEVTQDFPRIEEKDIRPGVGDVKYTIIVSQCDRFTISEHEVLRIMNLK